VQNSSVNLDFRVWCFALLASQPKVGAMYTDRHRLLLQVHTLQQHLPYNTFKSYMPMSWNVY